MHEFLKQKTFAVIGASNNTESYGYKITKSLLEHDYQVVPISLKNPTILGQKCYPKIDAYPEKIDVADFVVNPNIGIKLLDGVIDKGIKKIILQPGARSAELIAKAQSAGIEVVEDCVLMMLSRLNADNK